MRHFLSRREEARGHGGASNWQSERRAWVGAGQAEGLALIEPVDRPANLPVSFRGFAQPVTALAKEWLDPLKQSSAQKSDGPVAWGETGPLIALWRFPIKIRRLCGRYPRMCRSGLSDLCYSLRFGGTSPTYARIAHVAPHQGPEVDWLCGGVMLAFRFPERGRRAFGRSGSEVSIRKGIRGVLSLETVLAGNDQFIARLAGS
jgi:hypothetical protein